MKRAGGLLLAGLMVAGAVGSTASAGEARLKDGSVLQGELVTMVLQTPNGNIVQVGRDDLLLYVGGNQAAAAPAATAAPGSPTLAAYTGSSWGGRPEQARPATAAAPAAPVKPSPNHTRLEIHLDYESQVSSPEAADKSTYDSGETGEVFAFLPGQDGMKYAWIPLGTIRRVDNLVEGNMTPEQELAYLHTLLDDTEITARETIVTKLADKKTFTHRMHYVFDQQVSLPEGPFTLYVNLPKIRRHRKWHWVTFPKGGHRRFDYSWSTHSRFGR